MGRSQAQGIQPLCITQSFQEACEGGMPHLMLSKFSLAVNYWAQGTFHAVHKGGKPHSLLGNFLLGKQLSKECKGWWARVVVGQGVEGFPQPLPFHPHSPKRGCWPGTTDIICLGCQWSSHWPPGSPVPSSPFQLPSLIPTHQQTYLYFPHFQFSFLPTPRQSLP